MSITGGDKQNNTVPPGAECAARDEESTCPGRVPRKRAIQGDGGAPPLWERRGGQTEEEREGEGREGREQEELRKGKSGEGGEGGRGREGKDGESETEGTQGQRGGARRGRGERGTEAMPGV